MNSQVPKPSQSTRQATPSVVDAERVSLSLSREFIVKARVVDVLVGDRFGDCVLRWTNGARGDYLVSGVEADARKLNRTELFQGLVGEGIPGEYASQIVEACW